MKILRYNVYSQYLQQCYGEKVYKLPVNLPVTCPNRDGVLSQGGCIFCGAEGTGYEHLENTLSVREQLQINMDYIGKKYKAKKFIAYLQNFSNTYLPLAKLEAYLEQIVHPQIVEIAISTRPDCLSDVYIEFLKHWQRQTKKKITIELGLQTVNYHTLEKINRGHTLAEFVDSVMRLHKKDIAVCAHLILDLPWDNLVDVRENAKILSALQVEQVKLHSLYIVKNTQLAYMYKNGALALLTKEDYIERAILFLQYLHESIVVQRLIGRAPKENTLLVNWNTSWWKIKEAIEQILEEKDIWQGKKCNYLNGKALKNFSQEVTY